MFLLLRKCAFLVLLSCIVFGGSISSCQHTADTSLPVTSTDSTSYIRYATGFQVTKQDVYTIVHFSGQETSNFPDVWLVPQEAPAPEGVNETQIIRTPVSRIVVASGSQIGMLAELEALDKIVGVGNAKYVYSDSIVARVKSGKVIEVGATNNDELNIEKLVQIQPDLLITSGDPSQANPQHTTIRAAGIRILPSFDWLEKEPLARAEWMKLIALLVGKEDMGLHRFAFIAFQYNQMASLAAKTSNRPSILVGNNLSDTWYVPGGNNYQAQLLADAGAAYHWGDTPETGSIPLPFEAVYPVALHADIWINMFHIGSKNTAADIVSMDHRYKQFKAFKENKMYTFSKRVASNGANDFWESGASRPDLILGDLIKIFHPELLPDYTLYYYQPVQ